MNRPAAAPVDCVAAGRLVHARLDGPMEVERAAALDQHLAHCVSCRERAEALRQASEALASLPLLPPPDDALDLIWRATIAARRRRFVARPAAWAAAMLALAATVAWFADRRAAPTQTEVQQATRQIRFTFGIASTALERGGAAVSDALRTTVASALADAPFLRALEDAPERR